MSESAVKIRYDGPILANHSMDVTDLAPSLLAIADLCKNANKKFNGDLTAVKVLVNADLKQNCFELYLELAMSIFDQARQLISAQEIRDAKEILEWIGLIGGPAIGGFGLIRLVQAIGKGTIQSAELVQKDGKDLVMLTITGDNNTVQIHQTSPETYDMAKNPANINSVKRIVEPLTKNGYETLTFDQGKSGVNTVTKEDAIKILSVNSDDIADSLDEKEVPQVVTAWIKVYAPVYEPGAERWRFWFGSQTVYMDVSETGIADMALRRGGALVDDTYKVRLEIVQSKTSTKMSYKILEVLEFHPANLHTQIDFMVKDEPKDGGEGGAGK